MPVVVLACDQMITAGDIEFEPPQQKIWQLTSSIAMLIAGETSPLSEIYNAVRIDIQARLKADSTWMWVQEAADMVSRQIVQQHKLAVTRSVLEPLNLTLDSFMQLQPTMRPALYQQIMDEMAALRPDIAVIVAGVDLTGGHIYTVNTFGVIGCQDASGFAAIGSGGRLAASQFMAARHARSKPFAETQLLTYIAKRRAEAAPGVGENTDLAVIAGLGGYTKPLPVHMERLSGIFDQLEAAYAQITADAYESVKAVYQVQLDKKATAPVPSTNEQPSAAPSASGSPSSSASPSAPSSESPSASPSASPPPEPEDDDAIDDDHR